MARESAVRKTKRTKAKKAEPARAKPRRAATKPKAKARPKVATKAKAKAKTPKKKPTPKAKVASKPKVATTKKTKAPAAKAAKKRASAKPKASTALRTPPPPRPSERSVAASMLVPKSERSLDDVERSAMAKVATKARALLGGAGGTPADVVARIAAYVDEVRRNRTAPPRDQDELFGLGVLWGEQLRAQVGWLWVHLTYPDGLSSFALVPDDRAFAVFPINRLLDLLGPEATGVANTIAQRFEAICNDELPHRRPNAYLVIG